MLGSLLFFGLSGPALAQPVVVTDFRSTAQDASVAFLLYNELLNELDQAGISAVDGERVFNRMRVNPMECGADAGCRRDMLEAFKSPLVVVGEASTDGGTIVVTVRFYGWEKPNPVEVYQEWIEPGQEAQVLREIVSLADDLSMRLRVPPGSSGSSRDDARRKEDQRRRAEEDRRREDDRRRAEEERRREDERLQEQEREDRYDDRDRNDDDVDREEAYLDEVLSLDDEPESDTGSSSGGRSSSGGSSRAGTASERASMGIPEFLYRKYLASGMGSDEWLRAKRVRSRAFSIELQGGLGRGDTDRSYDVRVALDDQTLEPIGTYSFDTMLPGQWPQGMVGVGFNPTPWIELSVLGGIQYGQKFLTAGWERYQDDTLTTRDADAYDPVPALSAVIEPRLRLYPLMVGIAKPFFTLGYNVRIMDDYQVPDLNTVDFPDSPGRVIHGLTVGVGAMVDIHPRVALLVDIPMTLELAGHEPRQETSPHLLDVPLPCDAEEPPCHWGRLTRFSAGLQIRL